MPSVGSLPLLTPPRGTHCCCIQPAAGSLCTGKSAHFVFSDQKTLLLWCMYRVSICYWFNCQWWYIDFFLKSTKTLRISRHNHLPLLKAVPDLGCKLPSNGSFYLLKLLFKVQARGPGGREPLWIRRKWWNQKADFLKARVLSAPLQSMILEFPHIFFPPPTIFQLTVQ